MNTTIRKTAKIGKEDHVVILTSSFSSDTTGILNKSELSYIKSEIKNKKNLISINQYDRRIILQIIDNSSDEAYKNLESIRKSGHTVLQLLNKTGCKTISVVSDENSANTLAFAEGLLLSNYQFLKYKTNPEKNALKNINIVASKVSSGQLSELVSVCEAVCHARTLVNEPLIGLSAVQLSNAYKAMGKKAGFKVTVFNKAKIKSLKMGGLLAVNTGSIDPPTFTIMEWKPSKPVNKKPIVLVGKGVVYDTGGLSLKPTGNSMDYMKSDMAGAAVVGSTMYAIAKQKLPVHVIALVPATDNRPDGNAYTPGDVITMMSGHTVEVLNTDAEGRMILADALHYAKKYKPELVMEFSTLTGAAANAIGQYGIVAMGSCDEKTKSQLNSSGNNVYERLVEFPFWEEYDQLLKSDIADLKNIGGPVGGAITAGRFLQNFVDYPYMHFDIAGPSFLKSADNYRGKNGSGIGVRFIYDFIRNKASSKK